MGLVPIAHVFHGLDSDYLANHAGIDELFELIVEGGIAQDMADNDLAAGLLCGAQDGAALGVVGGDGLFQDQVVALFQGRDGVANVLAVLGADEHHIGQALLL